MTRATDYAFGDSELAARRLGLLAELFAPASRPFVANHAPAGPALAVDLGCGPGHTTRLLATATGAARTVGLDLSGAFLAAAARAAPAGVTFAEHDVRRIPFPPEARGAQLAYARLLLAHLPDTPAVIAGWCDQLAPGGRLLVEEAERIETDVPAFVRYLAYAERVLAARGATSCAGPRVDVAVRRPPARLMHNETVPLPVPVAGAAEMFALNLAVWRTDPVLAAEQPELDRLAADLDRLRTADAGHVTWSMRQIVLSP